MLRPRQGRGARSPDPGWSVIWAILFPVPGGPAMAGDRHDAPGRRDDYTNLGKTPSLIDLVGRPFPRGRPGHTRNESLHMSLKWKTAVAGAAAAIMGLTACGGSSGASDGGDTVDLVGFSILEQANKQVIDDFTKTSDGDGVEFSESYGASGDQARAVIGGQKADVVHLSLEPDVQK